MSLPQFPTDPSSMTRDDVINQILSSIAMEELGLSHIINAEGEKLQYVLGTLSGTSGPSGPGATIEDILAVNASVQKTLQSATQNQMFLGDKMANALSASTMQGPMGPTGPTGPSDGPMGPMGPTGPTGATSTITISSSGTWVVDGVDTGQSSLGATGLPGADGAVGAMGPTGATGATSTITISSSGTWVVDGVDTGQSSLGATGLPGADGAAGAAGATGPTGAFSATAPLFYAEVTGGTAIPVYLGDDLIFQTNTPEIITLDVSAGSAVVTIDSVGGITGATGSTGGTGATGSGAIITFDSGSTVATVATLELESVVGGLENTGVLIGDSSWGQIVGALGLTITLNSEGLPPFPIKVTRGGTVAEWAASFEAVLSAGVSIGTAAVVYADLLHAPALTTSPENLVDLNFSVIDTINLGDIPLTGAFQAYTGNQLVGAPLAINPGDYLIVHFYVDSLLVSSVTGFHAQASVLIN